MLSQPFHPYVLVAFYAVSTVVALIIVLLVARINGANHDD